MYIKVNPSDQAEDDVALEGREGKHNSRRQRGNGASEFWNSLCAWSSCQLKMADPGSGFKAPRMPNPGAAPARLAHPPGFVSALAACVTNYQDWLDGKVELPFASREDPADQH